jgi:hypothetical protein
MPRWQYSAVVLLTTRGSAWRVLVVWWIAIIAVLIVLVILAVIGVAWYALWYLGRGLDED